MILFVTKADGTKQPYDRKKILRTCLRMGVTREIAEKVAGRVETNMYEGIETKKLLQMIFRYLSKYKPSVKYRICLRKGLSLMKPKPDFERFIQILLSEHDYTVASNQIVRGKCVEHEIDAVAEKDGETYIVEVKHHYNYHTPTGLDESRIARAVFEDITEGFKLGLNNLKVDSAMIVCNTKFSQHAKRYADCRGIRKIGWSTPPNHGLQDMIEEKKLYPVSCLKGLDTKTREKLASTGVLLVKQLTTAKPEEIRRQVEIPRKTLASLIEKANRIVSERG
ncbi:MAG: restriction endonuclease [Candidatus Bathyarchaeota archaeon]|nr:MAG: restriction endonuclease [Candidatus Bathyarchaeota archaeon]